MRGGAGRNRAEPGGDDTIRNRDKIGVMGRLAAPFVAHLSRCRGFACEDRIGVRIGGSGGGERGAVGERRSSQAKPQRKREAGREGGGAG